MLALAFSVFLGVFQALQTGTVVGLVKIPGSSKPAPGAHVILLGPKYTEMWTRQVQQRLDTYWEIFKPELAVKKEHITDIYRMVHVEAFQNVTSSMRRELGSEGASRFMKDTSPAGQFEFRGIPLATYQILAETTSGGQDVVWSRTIDVDGNVPVFVDLSQPVS